MRYSMIRYAPASFFLLVLVVAGNRIALADKLLVRDTARQTPLRVRTAEDSAAFEIRKALDDQTEMEFAEMPLSDVVTYLKDRHHIEIQLDNKPLEEASIGPDSPVTRSVKGITLRSALQLMLEAMDLTYVIKNEVLLITTKDAQRSMVTVQVYDCGWVEKEQLADLIAAMKLVGCEEKNDQTGRPGAMGRPRQPAKAAGSAAVEIQIIPFGRSLVVRATPHDQEAITQLLTELQSMNQAGSGRQPATKNE